MRIHTVRFRDPQIGLNSTGYMCHATFLTDKSFVIWLNANGLNVPHDFKFAFTSASKAAHACPEAPETAAEAWEAISYHEVEVPSSWTLWVQRRQIANRPTLQRPVRAPAKLWRGLRSQKPRQGHGPREDLARRHSAARDALNIALSWKGRGRMRRSGARFLHRDGMIGFSAKSPASL